MKNLFRFIVNNIHWLLFFILLIVSITLLINNNEFQRSRYLRVSQEIAGRVQAVAGSVGSYIGLKSENDRLLNRIAELETQTQQYRRQLETALQTALVPDTAPPPMQQYRFIPARVVNNSVAATDNYITLDRGATDEVAADMGVLTPLGEVLGIVMNASEHFAKVMPLLNPKWSLSCKIKNTDFFGSLVWNGRDPRYSYLGDLPSHAVFSPGDTIVSSGYSAIFPEGIKVGVVDDSEQRANQGSLSLKIRLLADFSSLRHVLIVENLNRSDQEAAQKGAAK